MSKRNPNHYGSVTKLSGKRSRPFVVKVTMYDEYGFGHQKAVAYAETETEANILLAEYNNNPWDVDRETVTLADLYRRWKEVKLPFLGESNQKSLQAAYRHCSRFYGYKYRMIRAWHMQASIDQCDRGASTKNNIRNLWSHLDKFAYENDIIGKMYSLLLSSEKQPETKRVPFSREQIDALWAYQKASKDPWAEMVLMYLYTGFRINELGGIRMENVDLEERYMKGGLKTAAGKNRIVPIHSRIYPFVKAREGQAYLLEEDGKPMSSRQISAHWFETLSAAGIKERKVPHEARHTVETLLDNAGGNRRCIDLIMGHQSKDTGNRIYNHKTMEQLKQTIELLP